MIYVPKAHLEECAACGFMKKNQISSSHLCRDGFRIDPFFSKMALVLEKAC